MSGAVHAFEAAGLGRAPFRLIGVRNTADGADSDGLVAVGSIDGVAILTTPGGTCAFCGRAITVLCSVESSDGKRFHVGSDCVSKAGDDGMKKTTQKAVAERRTAAEDARIDRARKLLAESSAIRATLASEPHSRAWAAAQGRTGLDEVEWLMANSGHSGQLRTARRVEALSR